MKYCPRCGTECDDDALYCSKCGEKLTGDNYRPTSNIIIDGEVENDSQTTDQARTLGILSIVFAVIGINLVGIILGILGLTKKPNQTAKMLCVIGIIVSCLHMIVQLILWILMLTKVIDGFYYI